MRECEDWIPREWLGDETLVEQIEAEELHGRSELYLAEWREFISNMQPGDRTEALFQPEGIMAGFGRTRWLRNRASGQSSGLVYYNIELRP